MAAQTAGQEDSTILSTTNFYSSNSQTLALLGSPTLPKATAHGGASISYDDNALLSRYSIAEEENVFEYGDVETDTISVYIVRPGDTISQIAEMFSVSQNTIIWANNIRGKTIRVDQELIILPVSGIQYTIKKGDTISTIAKKFKGDEEEILAFNNLLSENLEIGTEITIPNGEPEQPKYVATKSTSSSSKTSYTNASGKTVWVNGIKHTPLRGTNVPNYNNYYIRPISGYGKSRGLHGYNAVDFAAPRGTPIVAAANGTVLISKKSGWNGGYGTYVAIKHGNGTQTLYAHMSSNIVYSGQSVVAGQVIGYVGTSGNSTGNHLHFEIRGAKNPF